jgi:hypothetical protein
VFTRDCTSSLSGITADAKRRLLNVYSCAQNTCVSAGSAASLRSEACIIGGVPSNMRPQPPANIVSPQNNAGPAAVALPMLTYAMCSSVWPGTASTRKS